MVCVGILNTYYFHTFDPARLGPLQTILNIRKHKIITCFLIQTENKPGALVDLLKPFQKRKINLSRIETSPSRESIKTHNFFIDSDGHQNDTKLKHVINDLKKSGAFIRILGSYPTEQ